MNYDDTQSVLKAFDLYTKLAKDGELGEEELTLYLTDNVVHEVLNQVVENIDCVLFSAGNTLYMAPKGMTSPFHVSNDYLKKAYLRSNATNSDLYLLYFATIVCIGEFYNSYHSKEPTKDFLSTERWIEAINERMAVLAEHSEEELKKLEKDFSYNWTQILEKWTALDDVKEGVKKQAGNTISRISFLQQVIHFLQSEKIAVPIGEGQIRLTERAKMIVQRYFMNVEYNNGILAFLYSLQEWEGSDAND